MSNGNENETRNDGAPEPPANAAPAGAAATGSAPAPVVGDAFATDEEDSGNTDARTEDGQTWARRYVTFERVHVTEQALAVLNQDNGGDSDRCRELKQNLNRTCAELELALAALERGMDLACSRYPYSLPGIFRLYTNATNNMGVSSSNSATAPRPSPPSLCSATSVEHGAPRREGYQSAALRSIGRGYQERKVPVLGDLVLGHGGCTGFDCLSLLGMLGYKDSDASC